MSTHDNEGRFRPDNEGNRAPRRVVYGKPDEYLITKSNLTDSQRSIMNIANFAAAVEEERNGKLTPPMEDCGMLIAVLRARIQELAKRYKVRRASAQHLSIGQFNGMVSAIERRIEGICAELKRVAPSLTLAFIGSPEEPVRITISGKVVGLT